MKGDATDLNYRIERLLATYLFTSPANAKYLGQFIDADATFVDQVPAQLLSEQILSRRINDDGS